MRLSEIRKQIHVTLGKPLLDPALVIEACETLSIRIQHGDYQYVLEQSGLSEDLSPAMLLEAASILSREALLEKMEVELGCDLDNPNRFPLGVLLHIGAGNMDGLPAYSVIEGLLSGNINLLKLPGDDPGISTFLLRELIQIEPSLKDYIYLFHLSSKEQNRIKQLMELTDGVVVWGADETVTAIRHLAPPNIKLIEWGHKLSFAYVTAAGIQEDELMGLAKHILTTRQLLCSSCQSIYLDTEDNRQIQQFCKQFLATLETASLQFSFSDPGSTARNTLHLYKNQLTSMVNPQMVGNCWVKPLPRQEIISTLHPYKGHLQTVGLLCGADEWDDLSYLFGRAGAVRIRKSSEMSAIVRGEAHDGEYPLRRYSKIMERA